MEPKPRNNFLIVLFLTKIIGTRPCLTVQCSSVGNIQSSVRKGRCNCIIVAMLNMVLLMSHAIRKHSASLPQIMSGCVARLCQDMLCSVLGRVIFFTNYTEDVSGTGWLNLVRPLQSMPTEAHTAGSNSDNLGWTWPTSCLDSLVNGQCPATPGASELVSLGEWLHGWPYHASRPCLGSSTLRIFIATTAKARIWSCCGRFASAWMAACPSSSILALRDEHLACAMCVGLGLAMFYGWC